MGKTKAEEREALTKIREILEGFSPEDTYVGKAFEGCIEQAEENIRNDWMLSWKGRYLDEQAKNCKYAEKVGELTRQLNQKDDAIARYMDMLQEANEEIGRLNGMIAERDKAYYDLETTLGETRKKLEKAQTEILKLKAKLYDTMTREEVEE